MRAFLIALILLACTSCCRALLVCRSEYLEIDHLASERINTPDPSRRCFFGEQIVVHWRIPHRYFQPPTELHLHIHYQDLTEETCITPIKTPYGYSTYRIMGDDFACRGGIIAYKAELYNNDCLIDTWTHSLWTDIITIDCEVHSSYP